MLIKVSRLQICIPNNNRDFRASTQLEHLYLLDPVRPKYSSNVQQAHLLSSLTLVVFVAPVYVIVIIISLSHCFHLCQASFIVQTYTQTVHKCYLDYFNVFFILVACGCHFQL